MLRERRCLRHSGAQQSHLPAELIRGEIAEGDRVILEGIQSVRPGMKIKDINVQQETAKTPAIDNADRG